MILKSYVRLIVIEKAGKNIEFRVKLSVSCIDKYIFLLPISWENYNESEDLKVTVELFKNYKYYFPESVHVDPIYRAK